MTLHEHLREPLGHQRQAPRRPPPGGFRRPLGQSLGTRRHDRSEGSQPTPRQPLGRPSSEAWETLMEPSVGSPNGPSERSCRTSQRAPPPPSHKALQTTSTRSLSTLREGLRKTPRGHPASSATTLHGGPTDDLNTLTQHPPRRSAKTPRGHPASSATTLHGGPRRPPQHPPPPPCTQPPQTTSIRSLSTLRKGLQKTPGDHPRELRHHPPRRPHRPLNTLTQHPPKGLRRTPTGPPRELQPPPLRRGLTDPLDSLRHHLRRAPGTTSAPLRHHPPKKPH